MTFLNFFVKQLFSKALSTKYFSFDCDHVHQLMHKITSNGRFLLFVCKEGSLSVCLFAMRWEVCLDWSHNPNQYGLVRLQLRAILFG